MQETCTPIEEHDSVLETTPDSMQVVAGDLGMADEDDDDDDADIQGGKSH